VSVEIPGVSAIRRHHAVEHATIAVIFQRRGRLVPVLGRSDFTGFHIHGQFSIEEVEAAADEAIRRMREGERHLAVTHLCGTNIAATGLLVGTAALVFAGRDRKAGWPRAMTMSMLATIAASRAGLLVQRYVTTDADIGDMHITRVAELGRRGDTRHLKVYLSG
jgi:hypothetical protein